MHDPSQPWQCWAVLKIAFSRQNERPVAIPTEVFVDNLCRRSSIISEFATCSGACGDLKGFVDEGNLTSTTQRWRGTIVSLSYVYSPEHRLLYTYFPSIHRRMKCNRFFYSGWLHPHVWFSYLLNMVHRRKWRIAGATVSRAEVPEFHGLNLAQKLKSCR